MSRSSAPPSKGEIWPLVMQADRATPPPYTTALTIEAARLAEFVSPALAAYLLHPIAAHHGRRLIAADPARESRLANRNARLRLLGWVEIIVAAGVEVAFVGDLANAHALYPDPDLRPVDKLDIVVAPGDVKTLVRHLGGHGFGAADEMSRAAVTLIAGDGCTILDLHLSLLHVPADQVIRAARAIEIDGARFRVPCLAHTRLYVTSAVAEAGFGRLCLREVLDAAMLLRLNEAIDWPTVHDITRASRLAKPLRTLLALLVDLGLAAGTLPANLIRPPRWPARRRFDRLADQIRELFQTSPLPTRA